MTLCYTQISQIPNQDTQRLGILYIWRIPHWESLVNSHLNIIVFILSVKNQPVLLTPLCDFTITGFLKSVNVSYSIIIKFYRLLIIIWRPYDLWTKEKSIQLSGILSTGNCPLRILLWQLCCKIMHHYLGKLRNRYRIWPDHWKSPIVLPMGK